MEKKDIKISLNSLLLIIYTFFLNGFYTLNGSVSFGNLIKIMIIICIVIGSLKIVLNLRKKIYPDLFVIVIALIIMIIFYLNSKDTRLAIGILSMIVYLYADVDKVIRYFLFSKAFFYFTVMLTGGYGHINGVAIHGGILLLIYICKRDKKLKWMNIIAVFIGFMILSLYTNSGSAKIAMICTMILLLSIKLNKFQWLYKSKIIIYTYPIALFVNYFCAVTIGTAGKIAFIGSIIPYKINSYIYEFILFLDKVTTSRLTLANYSLANFGVSFWKGNIDFSILELGEGGYFNLDSGFMWLLQGWGGFMTIIFCIMTIFLIRYFIKYEKYNYVITAVVIALWGINEDILLSVGTNFLIIFMLKSILSYLNEKKIKKMKRYS